MDKYDLLQQIGDGTFGSVAKAVHKKSGQLVAVKRMKQKYYSWEECVNLPEVQVLRKLQAHPNVIKLREVVRENNELFFVFEFMDGDLLGVIRKCKQSMPPAQALTAPAVSYTKVKSYMFQLMQALAFLHKSGYFHRDLKPENLLIRKDAMQSQEIVKLADFGLVKEVRARPPYTDYVSTRWYRAPELLLQDRNYTCAVDVWAAGCIFSELMTTKPLFPGNNEVDQLFKIMSVFGSPTEATWPDGIQLARKIRYQFPMIASTPLRGVLPPHVPPAALDLLSKMLVYDPKKRMTAQQCLTHPFFNVGLDEEPLTAYCASTVSRPQGGAQSAPVVPNANPMQTPVQWRQAAEKDSANSANKAPALGGQAVQPPANTNRPASGNRPMFPPVEISKHVVTNTTSNGSNGQQHHSNPPVGAGSQANHNDGSLSRYYLVPSGLSPKQREAMQPGYNNYGSSGVASPVPTKQAMEGLTPPQRPPTKLDGPVAPKPNAGQHAAQQTKKQASNKATHSVDLDQLMEDFEHEMSAMGFHTRKEGVAQQQSNKSGAATHPTQHRASPALTRKSPQVPTPVSSNKIQQQGGAAVMTPTSTVGFKGLPQPLSAAYNNNTDELSPIQKLLNNSRYKPSHASSGGSAGGPVTMPAHLAGTPTFHHQQHGSVATQPPAQLNANSVHSPSAVTAANRYDLDSASFASLDVGAMSFAGSTGGKKAVLGNATISPSVNTLLSRQSFKPAPLSTQADDSELPSWLRMVNDKTKRSTPTEFGKVLPLAGSRR